MTGNDKGFVLIGAGSTVFTPGLLRDITSSGKFEDYTVHLVDLDARAVETMAAIGRRLARHHGSSVRFEAHTDRRAALRGARFVTTTIAVGGAQGWRADLDIPARYGIRQTVGDSVGPGGVLRALRHVPELVAIASDIADLAPRAWLINYSNPLTANVRAITGHTPTRAIGLCHGTMHTKSALCKALGHDTSEVHAVFAGINHLCWLLDIRHDDTDLYPRLRAMVREQAGGPDAPSAREEGVHAAVSADLMRTYGRYPAPGDRHAAEFFPNYLTRGKTGDLPWGLQGGQDMTIEYIGEKDQLWDELRAQADGSHDLLVADNQEAERVVGIAAAMLGDQDTVELAVNLPNEGKIPNLPPYAVVEVPAVVGADRITGLGVGALPQAIAAVLSARVDQQELTVRAAITGERDTAIQALTLDPLVGDARTATAILDDAVRAHAPFLDRFAAE
jgi:alpha-galactosidase/6-phospho-beta-glucosidase family protein